MSTRNLQYISYTTGSTESHNLSHSIDSSSRNPLTLSIDIKRICIYIYIESSLLLAEGVFSIPL